MKEIIGKMHQHNKSKLPRKLLVNKKYITLETEIGLSLARKIPTPSKSFENFLKKASTILPERWFTINEMKDIFFP